MKTQEDQISSYKLALAQMISYRNIREIVNGILRPYDLNSTKWIILHLVHDQPDHYRVTDIANMLQVKGTLVTTIIGMHVQMGRLTYQPHPSDKRARLLAITSSGIELLAVIDDEMLKKLPAITVGLTPGDITKYYAYLKTFIANTQPLPPTFL